MIDRSIIRKVESPSSETERSFLSDKYSEIERNEFTHSKSFNWENKLDWGDERFWANVSLEGCFSSQIQRLDDEPCSRTSWAKKNKLKNFKSRSIPPLIWIRPATRPGMSFRPGERRECHQTHRDRHALLQDTTSHILPSGSRSMHITSTDKDVCI